MTALGAYNSNLGSFFTLSTFDEHDKHATFGKVDKNILYLGLRPSQLKFSKI